MLLRFITIVLGVGLIMAATEAPAQSGFKLKAPSEYFSNSRSVALLQAALAGDLSKAKQLVSEGANFNDEGPMADANANRLRLLHYAVAANSKPGVQTLLAAGADPELDAQHYGNAFLFALTIDHLEMLSFLLDQRSFASLKESTKKSLLFESVRLPRPRGLELLLKRGAPVDFRDARGYTILMTALGTGDLDLAEWLIDKVGASAKIDAVNGVTPGFQVQSLLARVQPASESYAKLQRIKRLMEAQGAIFPAPDPAAVRARRNSQ
jgi:ankyrin repeat protein